MVMSQQGERSGTTASFTVSDPTLPSAAAKKSAMDVDIPSPSKSIDVDDQGTLDLGPAPTSSRQAVPVATASGGPATAAARVYLATYSNVPVYELTVRGIAVMRRRADGFLNATQILKVAGVEKGRRTKILEKEILTGHHEKVQGGYGKYQGTWIPLRRAQELSAKYNVAHLLKPLLEFDASTAGSLTTAPKGKRPNPNAPAAQRLNASAADDSTMSVEGDDYALNGGADLTEVTAVNAAAGAGISGEPSQKPRFLKLRPPPATGAVNDPPSTSIQEELSAAVAQSNKQDDQPPSKRARLNENDAEDSVMDASVDYTADDMSVLGTPSIQNISPVKDLNSLGPAGGSALRAARFSGTSPSPFHHNGAGVFVHGTPGGHYHSRSARVVLGPPDNLGQEANGARFADRAQAFRGIDENQERPIRELLTGLFLLEEVSGVGGAGGSEESTTTSSAPGNESQDLSALLGKMSAAISLGGGTSNGNENGNPENPNVSVNVIIDDHGHAPLHWASALSKLSLVRLLLARPPEEGGANVNAGNFAGETALHRSVLVTNSYEQGSFPRLLKLLGASLDTRDYKRRTILHHIAMVAALRGRSAPARYYLACVLEHLSQAQQVRSLPSQQQHDSEILPMTRQAVQALINAQDDDGETALGIVARIGNASMIRMLLEVGARKDLLNHFGIKPADWGLEQHSSSAVDGTPATIRSDEADADLAAPAPGDSIAAMIKPPRGPTHSSKDVLDEISKALEEVKHVYEHELAEKQRTLRTAQTKLQAETRVLAQRRRTFSQVQAKVAQRDEHRHSITNLNRVIAILKEGVTHVNEAAVEQQLAALEVPGNSDVKEIIRLRWLHAWYRQSCGALTNRIASIEEEGKTKEAQCRKVVALCCGIPEGSVVNILDDLVIAIESDGVDMDLARVANFLSKVSA